MSCHSSNFVTLLIGARFAPSVPFCSSLTSKTLQKYHRRGKNIANHIIVNFNSYKLCLSDIFDGQEYWT